MKVSNLYELKEKQNLSMTKSEVWLPMHSAGELEGGVGNIGGDVNILLCLVTQSCPTLCDAMDCSPPGSSVDGDSPGKNTGVG